MSSKVLICTFICNEWYAEEKYKDLVYFVSGLILFWDTYDVFIHLLLAIKHFYELKSWPKKLTNKIIFHIIKQFFFFLKCYIT